MEIVPAHWGEVIGSVRGGTDLPPSLLPSLFLPILSSLGIPQLPLLLLPFAHMLFCFPFHVDVSADTSSDMEGQNSFVLGGF